MSDANTSDCENGSCSCKEAAAVKWEQAQEHALLMLKSYEEDNPAQATDTFAALDPMQLMAMAMILGSLVVAAMPRGYRADEFAVTEFRHLADFEAKQEQVKQEAMDLVAQLAKLGETVPANTEEANA